MSELPDVTPEQDAAIRDAITARTGLPMITRYTVLAEGVQADGEPRLTHFHDDALPVWDEIGMHRSILTALEHQFAINWWDDET